MDFREKWLLAILSVVFAMQAGTLLYGMHLCSKVHPDIDVPTVCPRLGERFDSTFGTMIATTLALLTGSAVVTSAGAATYKPKPPPPGRK